MSAKFWFRIASCCALSCVLCAGAVLRAQATRPAYPSTGTSFEDSTNELSVTVGKTVLVDCAAPITRVAVGTGDIAEAIATSPTEIMVSGKTVGETSLIIWDSRGGRQFFNVTVRPSVAVADDHLESVRRELRLELPGQAIKVSYDNQTIFLRGTVKDLTSSERAVKIASTAGKVVNLLDVQVPASKPQILLKVRFCSVDRSLEKQLGINLFNLGLGNGIGGVSTGQYSPPSFSTGSATSSSGAISSSSGQALISNDLNILAFFPGLNAGATLQALQTRGLVEVLAEPNLLAADGKEASFLAGGEYPYPVVQGTSAGGSTAVTIEFKEYGIRLNFIPTITPRGTIRLQVAPEVSSLDYTDEVDISGFEVPGITTRKVNTEVELKDGQTFVIGGLLDNTETETFEKIPFIGDIPILGKLFQSMTRTKNNTELIVVVTPEIVAPIPAGQTGPELHYPVKFLPPNTNAPPQNPDAKTPENTPPPAPPTLPVEKLIESMQPEKPLVIESSTGAFGAGSTGAGTGASGNAAPAPSSGP